MVNLYNGREMRIELSLLSAVSIACLLLFCGGGDVNLHTLDIDFSLTSNILRVSLDPVWAIWSPQLPIPNCDAFAWGNVMVFQERDQGTIYGDYAISHELIHVRQFQALGWWIYPAQYILNIEPDSSTTRNWNDLTQSGRTMWQPPKEWKSLWSFVTLRFGEERT